MGFGSTGLGMVMGAVIKLVSVRFAAIFSTTGLRVLRLPLVLQIVQIVARVEAPIAQS
jgi:hypothetical protein